MQDYEYVSLGNERSVRLIYLEPGTGNNPLACELKVHRLGHETFEDPLPEFLALSYVWGRGAATHVIHCGTGNLNISENLYEALRRIRTTTKQVVIWADGICINQNDLVERKKQVSLMRHIYWKASSVVVFIQPRHSSMSEADAAMLANVMNALPITKPKCRLYGFIPFAMNRVQVKPKMFRSRIPAKSDPFWRLLALFFDNPWFSRIWVIQEVANSSKTRVLLGDHQIDWDIIVHVVGKIVLSHGLSTLIQTHSKTNGLRNLLVMAFMARINVFAARSPVPSLLQLTRDFQSSDPRDKVYALLQVPIRRPKTSTDFRLLNVQAYLPSLLIGAVLLCIWSATLDHGAGSPGFYFKIVVLTWVTHRLKLLTAMETLLWDISSCLSGLFVTASQYARRNMPEINSMSNTLLLTADYSYTTQTVYKTVTRKLIQQSGSLGVLSNVQHGEIKDPSFPSWVPRWDMESNGIVILGELHQWQASAGMKHEWSVRHSDEDHLAVKGLCFSKVAAVSPILGGTDTIKPDELVGGPMTMNTHGRALSSSAIGVLTAGTFMAASPKLSGRSHWIKQPCFGRRQFVTENGHIGLGSQNMQVGDIVCVLFGGCVPYVLRSSDTPGYFKFIGESYVDGIMHGEVVADWRRGLLVEKTFILC
ncbi:hypothetical protein G7054_g1645 [Neopestalotiopsis clavispora]|nr:hypothetical protein G7054_g1645 [Neopestalotiopsis clavispora]